MDDQANDGVEEKLKAATRAIRYPPTPDIATAVRRRLSPDTRLAPTWRNGRWAQAALALALAFIGLLGVPAVRAAILEILQIGAVRIFLIAPTATPTASSVLPATPTLVPSLMDIAGRTTLEEAQRWAGFDLLVPTYPEDIGAPDAVFKQEMGEPMIVLVWLDESDPPQVQLSLHAIAQGSFAVNKFQPSFVQAVVVRGTNAVWAQGPYLLQITGNNYDERRLIEGHVLIWQEGTITYRLESALPLNEALLIAESLR